MPDDVGVARCALSEQAGPHDRHRDVVTALEAGQHGANVAGDSAPVVRQIAGVDGDV
jgi:hypothetical protein